jgi:hypothetical protein
MKLRIVRQKEEINDARKEQNWGKKKERGRQKDLSHH